MTLLVEQPLTIQFTPSPFDLPAWGNNAVPVVNADVASWMVVTSATQKLYQATIYSMTTEGIIETNITLNNYGEYNVPLAVCIRNGIVIIGTSLVIDTVWHEGVTPNATLIVVGYCQIGASITTLIAMAEYSTLGTNFNSWGMIGIDLKIINGAPYVIALMTNGSNAGIWSIYYGCLIQSLDAAIETHFVPLNADFTSLVALGGNIGFIDIGPASVRMVGHIGVLSGSYLFQYTDISILTGIPGVPAVYDGLVNIPELLSVGINSINNQGASLVLLDSESNTNFYLLSGDMVRLYPVAGKAIGNFTPSTLGAQIVVDDLGIAYSKLLYGGSGQPIGTSFPGGNYSTIRATIYPPVVLPCIDACDIENLFFGTYLEG